MQKKSTNIIFLFLIFGHFAFAQQLFWADSFEPGIYQADRDGSSSDDMSPAIIGSPTGIAFDPVDRMIYIVDKGDGFLGQDPKIYRMDENGDNVETLITSVDTPNGLAIDAVNRKIYWAERGSRKVQRADLDGTNIEDIVAFTGFENPYSVALDVANNRLFISDSSEDLVWTADLEGNNLTAFPEDGMALDYRDIDYNPLDDKVYWLAKGSIFGNPESRIFRANPDGTDSEAIILLEGDDIAALEIDTANQKLIWSNLSTDVIFEANFDGSDATELLDGSSRVEDIAMDYGIMSPTFQFGKVALNVQVSPNPASELITVQLSNASIGMEKLVLYDVSGQQVAFAKVTGQKYAELPIDLPTQIYWLKIELDNGQAVAQKVVIER